MKLKSTTNKPIPLKPVQRNAGLEALYRKQLVKLVDEMNASLLYWLRASYRANTPLLAQDASPADALRKAMSAMAKRWLRNFDEGADKLAKLFADKSIAYTDPAFNKVLRDAGFTVKFTMTSKMRDAYAAIVGENVSLIKSIAQQNLTQVETLVMQSVAIGRNMGELTDALGARFDITRKRAAFIARDQNQRATAILTRARQLDLGITHARWRHSTAGREPRVSHVKAGRGVGELYEIAKGCLIDGEYILPGELINCRCTAVPIIPGFDDDED